MNRTLKDAIQLARSNNLNWKQVLQDRINAYRVTPHSTTGKTPFELFRGRIANTRLTPGWMKWGKGLVDNRPGYWHEKEEKKQRNQKRYYDKTKRVKINDLEVGDVVRVKSPVGCANYSKYSKNFKDHKAV